MIGIDAMTRRITRSANSSQPTGLSRYWIGTTQARSAASVHLRPSPETEETDVAERHEKHLTTETKSKFQVPEPQTEHRLIAPGPRWLTST